MREHQAHPGPSVPQWWAGTKDAGTYRRYQWTLDSLHNCYYIKRNGTHISTETSLAAVKATIDLLTSDAPTCRTCGGGKVVPVGGISLEPILGPCPECQ